MSEANVKVICRFRPINKLERTTWENNRLAELLKKEELDSLTDRFKMRKNKKYADPRHWRSLSQDTRALKLDFKMSPNNILRFQRLTAALDVNDWDDEKRFLRENLGVDIYPAQNQVQTMDAFGNNRAFNFDKVLWTDCSQQEAFACIGQPMIKDALQGINGTLFAYGQTGSGKTFTSFGPEPIQKAPLHMLGVIPLSFSYLFETCKRDDEVKDLSVNIEIVEIYTGKLRDLLEPLDPKTKKDKTLKCREVEDIAPGEKKAGRGRGRGRGRKGRGRGRGKKKKTKKAKEEAPKCMEIVGVFQAVASSIEDIQTLLAKATKNRTKNATNMNQSSSRSHLIMRAKTVQRKTDGSIVHAWLTFCDLAGSEKVRKTNVVGKQLEEAKDINKQLTCLRNVIDAIVKKKKFVAFSDSMLTKVLKHSLSGNVKTSVLICCSPHAWNQAETLSALTFGSRCKLIKNKIVANKDYSKEELMKKLDALQKENAILKAKVSQHAVRGLINKLKEKSLREEQVDVARVAQMEVELETLRKENRRLQIKLKQFNEDGEVHAENAIINDELMCQELIMLKEHLQGNDLAREILDGVLKKFNLQPSVSFTLSPSADIVRKMSFPGLVNEFEKSASLERSPRHKAATLSETDRTMLGLLDRHIATIRERTDPTMLNPFMSSKKTGLQLVPSNSFSTLREEDISFRRQQSVRTYMRQPSDSVLILPELEEERERVFKESSHLQGFAARFCDLEAEIDKDITESPKRKLTMIVAKPDGSGFLEIDEDGNEQSITLEDMQSQKKALRESKNMQPTLSDPILNLVSNLTSEHIKELRTLLRNGRRQKGFVFDFHTLVTQLDLWKVSDIAAFWVILSSQQQKKVTIVQAIGFCSRLELYMEKRFTAEQIESELGEHATQFREILSTVPAFKFSEIDLDGNDEITLEELCKHLHMHQSLVVERLFQALDEDGNGAISRMEFDVLKQNLQKDMATEISKSEEQKRLNMYELFFTFVPDLEDLFQRKGFADEDGKLTEIGASHILCLLRDTTPGAKLENDLGLLYLVGLDEKQVVALMHDIPRQIWSQLVENPVE